MRWLILLGDSRCRVLKALLLQATIAVPAIGKNVAAGFDLVGEELLQRLCAASEITSRAANPGTGFLPGLPGPRCSTATAPRIWSARRVCHARAAPRHAPHHPHSLIDLHQAAEPVVLIAVAHRLANLVQHQPGGGVTDADFLGQLHRRDALLVVAHAIDRPKPTAERVRVL